MRIHDRREHIGLGYHGSQLRGGHDGRLGLCHWRWSLSRWYEWAWAWVSYNIIPLCIEHNTSRHTPLTHLLIPFLHLSNPPSPPLIFFSTVGTSGGGAAEATPAAGNSLGGMFKAMFGGSDAKSSGSSLTFVDFHNSETSTLQKLSPAYTEAKKVTLPLVLPINTPFRYSTNTSSRYYIRKRAK